MYRPMLAVAPGWAVPILMLWLASTGCGQAQTADCTTLPLGVQVLGSGGPMADDDRASTGYVVWVEGRARLLIDAGGGVFVRWGESGARVEDLDALLVTHLHVDHTADLPALLKSASFGSRNRPLPLIGPTGADRFPGIDSWTLSTFAEGGAYGYLAGYVDGSGQPFVLEVTELDTEAPAPATAFENDRLRVDAVGVPHGIVPSLGYVVTVGDRRIGFASDQRADDARFAQLAEGVDVLVAHYAIGIDASREARQLHATPAALGRLASEVDAGRLVLSHHMARSLRDRRRNLAEIGERYEGPLSFADDLQCIPVR